MFVFGTWPKMLALCDFVSSLETKKKASITWTPGILFHAYDHLLPIRVSFSEKKNPKFKLDINRTANIKHKCSRTSVLSCHRCLTNTGVEEMKFI